MMSSDGDLGSGAVDTSSLLESVDGARALAAVRTGALGATSSSELDEGLISADAVAALNKAGGGILGGASLGDNMKKFRWDKPSRLVRMRHGTTCYRFTLLFLSVIIVFSGYF